MQILKNIVSNDNISTVIFRVVVVDAILIAIKSLI